MTLFEILNAVGLFGAGLYLLSYTLLQLGYIGGNSTTYILMNLTAASCVAISLIVSFNAASVVIQVSWIVISIVGLVRMHLLSRVMRFSEDDAAFLQEKLPGLTKVQGRKVLDLGLWIDGDAGTELTSQGKPNANLIYLNSGGADVYLNDKKVAVCSRGDFVGEMTALSGDVATATVRLNAPSQYLMLDTEALRKLAAQEQTVAEAVKSGFVQNLKSKLEATNLDVYHN